MQEFPLLGTVELFRQQYTYEIQVIGKLYVQGYKKKKGKTFFWLCQSLWVGQFPNVPRIMARALKCVGTFVKT